MKKILHYITYQTFPADTANSLQTVSNLKYFVKNNYEVSLYFPLREKNSSRDLEKIQKKYKFDETINVFGTSHPYPFGKIHFFKRFFYHLSHFLWARKTSKNFTEAQNKGDNFLTRSDWVLYFLSKKNLNIIFECHQYSKLRNYIFEKVSHFDNVKIIYLNELIKKEFNLPSQKTLILASGVDLELFQNIAENEKLENKIVFVGNLLRFGKQRNLESILRVFQTLEEFSLTIVGGPTSESNKLINITRELNLSNVIIKGRLSREETINEILSSSYGLLINSNDKHSRLFTSPLKYFEYLAAKLKVIAVDFPSHNLLPEQNNIYYFDNEDIDSLKSSIYRASENKFVDVEIAKYSLNNRVKQIINLFDE
ncbi:MAG: glycosyltransferase [Flavobacteriaceae bacterium TMED238]|nr:MAG: glycosyltransferase [Flavobacteriaceae bacterium TMED238]|tara:strand:- start:49 stop:1152 length:1104 start_codon:yes stop_codon:yes gene_type:complete